MPTAHESICGANQNEIRSNLKLTITILWDNLSNTFCGLAREPVRPLPHKLTAEPTLCCVVQSDLRRMSAWRVLITQQNGSHFALFCCPLMWAQDNGRQSITTYYKCIIVLPSKSVKAHARCRHATRANTVRCARSEFPHEKFNETRLLRSAVHRLIGLGTNKLVHGIQFIQVWDFKRQNMYSKFHRAKSLLIQTDKWLASIKLQWVSRCKLTDVLSLDIQNRYSSPYKINRKSTAPVIWVWMDKWKFVAKKTHVKAEDEFIVRKNWCVIKSRLTYFDVRFSSSRFSLEVVFIVIRCWLRWIPAKLFSPDYLNVC